MTKRNKLYTVNKWNRSAFIPKDENLFWNGGLAGNQTLNDYLNSTNFLGIKKKDNPFSKVNLMSTFSSEGIGNTLKGGMGAAARAIGGAVGDAVGGLIGGGLNSGAGGAISGLGKTVGGAIGSVNPVLGAAVTAASGIIGGGVNALVGTAVDQEKLNAAKEGTAALNNFTSNATSLDDIKGPEAQLNVQDAYSSGLLNKGWAKKRNAQLKEARADAASLAYRGIENNADNLMADQLNDELANYSAFGGPLDMGAINYDFMTDYLISKNKKTENNSQMTNMFANTPSTMFAFGGDMETNSADFSTGLTHVDAGGSHSENPNDGVQMGVDQNGVPNLVEENETIFNDYVFSNRIMADSATKEMFKLPKKKDITFAEISKKLEKEISERPADPISEAGFKSMMQKLEEQQERQKAEMEAERARAAFEALSPEEQAAVMQQKAEQEAMAQQAAEEQAIAEQQAAQPSPEEMQMIQQQAMQADGTQAALGQEVPMMAEGGKLFKDGGQKKNVGSWKDDKENHWDVFTKPGLKRFIENVKAQLNMAPDDETKNKIRREAMNELNTLQQSYYDYVRDGAANSTQGYSEDVLNHQKMFDRLFGNTGFYSKDENGNIKNLIADAINLPNGAATDDKPDNWFDGYNGPRTSIRNFGSTAYGDDSYYKDLVDEFAGLGLTYAPNDNWKDNNGTLYGLSIPEAEDVKTDTPKAWDWNQGDWVDRVVETPKEKSKPATNGEKSEEEQKKYKPVLKDERLRYAGLFGPAIGLGMMAAGIGKPDTESLEAAVRGAGNVHLADYQPIGDYLTYRPMDIWFEQNKLDSQARATDRAILNTGANQGSKAAALLASGYNSQLASGELYRKALEYNDALEKQVKEFNRGTNQFNAEAYNRLSQFNADAKNRANQAASSLALQAAREKLDADAGWYNSLYGNIGGIFEGLANIGTENARHNMLARLAADGVLGNLGNAYTGNGYVKEISEGSKIKKKKNKRGLTF